jgi:hypothetical protein
VTIDNTQNASDMLVKLFDRSTDSPVAVRIFFLRANDQFTLKGVKPGAYDIRYQDLDHGVISKSEPFSLTEHEEVVPEANGTSRITHYSKFRLTLYTVENGNTRFTVIGPEEF